MVRVTQPVLPLLPAQARSVGPSAGLLEGPKGAVVFVFGLATFNYAAGDQAGRRLAAVQLVTTRIASASDVAAAFAVSQATLWRWVGAFAEGGVLALVRERPGPRRASKLTQALAARIVALEATGLSLLRIAAQTGVSTATVRVALGRVAPRTAPPVELPAEPTAATATADDDAATVAELAVLPWPVPRTVERAAARAGDLVEAPVVITQGAHLPQAGLLLALPALEMTGLLAVAEQTFPPMSKGFYGLRATRSWGCSWRCCANPAPRARPGCARPTWAGCSGWTARRRSRRCAASWPSWPGTVGRAAAGRARHASRHGPSGGGRVPLPRRACAGLLRDPAAAQDPHRPDADRRSGDRGDLGR